jgi:glycerol-3-phosphate dehydrogenase
MTNVAVIGAGSWGTTVANVSAPSRTGEAGAQFNAVERVCGILADMLYAADDDLGPRPRGG